MSQDQNQPKKDKLFPDEMFDDIPEEDETPSPGSPTTIEQDEMWRDLRNKVDLLTYLESISGKYIRIYNEDYTLIRFTERAVIMKENDSGEEAIIPQSQIRVDEQARFYIRAWVLSDKFPE